MSLRLGAVAVLAVGCLALASCTGPQRGIDTRQEAAGIDELSALYAEATAPHRRAVRKPIRDQREDALRRLSATAEVIIAETQTWNGDAQLTSIAESQRDEVRATVLEFRESLRGIKESAEQADLRQLREQYAMAMAHYRALESTALPIQ